MFVVWKIEYLQCKDGGRRKYQVIIKMISLDKDDIGDRKMEFVCIQKVEFKRFGDGL